MRLHEPEHKEEAAKDYTKYTKGETEMKYSQLTNGNGSTQAESGTANDKTSTPNHKRKGSKRAQELHNVSIKRAGNPSYPDHKPSNKLHEQSAGARRAGE